MADAGIDKNAAQPDPRMMDAMRPFLWPFARIGEGIEELSRRSGLRPRAGSDSVKVPAAIAAGDARNLADWFEWAAEHLGIEANLVQTPVSEMPDLLRTGGPAVFPNGMFGAPGVLLLIGWRRGRPLLLAPDLRIRSCDPEHLRGLICWPREGPLIPDITRLVRATGIDPAREPQVRAAMLREQLAQWQVERIWVLRLAPSASFWKQLSRIGAFRKVAALTALFAISYVAEIAGWVLIGSAALGGTFDLGWFMAWLLLMVTMIPLQTLGAWWSATLALDAGRLLKARLLAGALRMSSDSVKRQGVGQLLSRVVESQALESLSLNGGMSLLRSILQLGFAAWIVGQGVAPTTHLLLLGGWTLLAIALSWNFFRKLRTWTITRLDMTHELIEVMVGHRTRLAQEPPQRSNGAEDSALQNYLQVSGAMDWTAVTTTLGVSSGWVILGLIGLVPAFVGDLQVSSTAIAISLGGILFAQRAFGGISEGLAATGRAWVAWNQVAPMFRAARNKTSSQTYVTLEQMEKEAIKTPLIDAQALSFAYPSSNETVIEGTDLVIGHGDRILLEGASGGGKSTLAGLLTGLNTPRSGLLLLNGLDRHTLGDDWHRLATSAPQFHENHILSGSVAFNLLMGRQWPAPGEDLKEAQDLCVELGLGPLLQRMPGGINQYVGETGWQLSHGERSRIFLARALLQRAHLTVLDESFAALDPETLALCLDCSLKRARTLMVIAHP
ncbi:MAG: ATP-binding cassette, subfamily bacterial [Sphingomonadales bacterium]|jgi:ATP-binding cassette subfamily B protein|nr:ATP-binding cassette, subfamily bacterial [Sphingomonadales bacterium]